MEWMMCDDRDIKVGEDVWFRLVRNSDLEHLR